MRKNVKRGGMQWALPRLGDKSLGVFLTAIVLFAGDLARSEQVVAQVGGRMAVFFDNVRALDESLVERSEDDLHVAPEGDVLDIFQVVIDLGFPRDGVAAVNLGQAAQSLANAVALALFRGHKDQVAHKLRPRADYGHVALQYIEEFGELVQAGAAQESSVTVETLLVGEQVALRIALVCHGAELDQLEDFFVLAGARLRKEGVSPHDNGAEKRQ